MILLTFLANVEDFALYVKGKELHFEPRPTEQTDRYVIAWEPPSAERGSPVANVVSLQFSRALTIAKGITVEVHSWNAKQKKGFTASWPKAAKAVSARMAAALWLGLKSLGNATPLPSACAWRMALSFSRRSAIS